jgi:hypothetical protein
MKPWLFVHHRAASTWTSQFVSEYAQKTGRVTCGTMNTFRQEPSYENVRKALEHPWALAVNPWPSLPAQISVLWPSTEWKAVHIVRDPRDVLISAYFSCRDYHPTTDWPELAPFKAWLRRVNVEDGIIATMGWVSFVLDLADWTPDPNVLEIDYAELFAPGEDQHILAMLDWLFPPVATDLARELIHKHSWEVRTGGRQRGVEDTAHHYRKGVAGDWKRHWTKRIDKVWKEAYPCRS